jgi:hypothetical protein
MPSLTQKISNTSVTKERYVMSRTPPLSIINEVATWQELQSMCQQSLEAYPHTLNRDREIFAKADLSGNQQNIMILRMGEKRILTQLIEISAEVLLILSSTDIVGSLKQKVDKCYARYLYKILSLTPGINRQEVEASLGATFAAHGKEECSK